MDSFGGTISVHVVYKLLYLHFSWGVQNNPSLLCSLKSHTEDVTFFLTQVSSVLFFASMKTPIKQPYRQEMLFSPPFAQLIAVDLPCGDDTFCPLSKKSQVSFPRVLSLFKMRTQCSDTTLSLVRAVLGTDETLDC